MKNTILLLTLFTIFGSGYAQLFSESFILDSPIPANQTKEWVARDFVWMKNNYPAATGFSAKPDVDNLVHAKIDPMLVFPPHEGTTGGLPNNNQGGAVGSLPGLFNVSSYGASNYSIPIEIPEGLAGLTPELKFVYNSQAGDGIMGDGWALSGLSKISRVPFSYYYNNFTSSVVLNAQDQLILDGNYLRKTNETEYKQEVEDFSKIAWVNSSNINDGFIVYKPNGFKYYYGIDEQSRYYLQSGPPIAWYLTKIVDNNNNYIDFYYKNDRPQGSFYPDYILYTGNTDAGTEPYYRISFKYLFGERIDSPKKYFTNPDNPQPLFSRITKYLSGVTVTYLPNEKDMIDYTLVYKDEGFIKKKYLTAVFPTFDSDGTRLNNHYNPTTFNWFHSDYKIFSENEVLDLNYNDEIEMFEQQSIIACNFANRNIDNMPLSDILHISKTNHDNKYHLRVYLNESRYFNNGFYFRLGSTDWQTPFEFSGFEEATENFLISTGDFNGDGFDEIVRVYKMGTQLKVAIGNFNYNYPLDGYNEYFTKTIDYNSSFNVTPKFLIGDFSGNGFDDLCIIFNNGSLAYCYFFLSEKNAPFENEVTSTGGGMQWPEKILLGDFNGNLKKEIVVIGDTESSIVSLRADNAAITRNVLYVDWGNYNSSNDYVAGDFNNDAKTDILLLTSAQEDNWTFYFSYGKGDFVKKGPLTIESIGSGGESRIATDLNGDGYSDLCWVWYDDNSGTWEYYRKDFLINPMKEDIEIIDFDYNIPISTIIHGEEKQEIDFCLGNFTGNSSSQLISSNIKLLPESGGGYDLYARINLSASIYDPYINNIELITNGLGVETKVHYCPFSAIPFTAKKEGGFEPKNTNNYDFPINDYKGILNVVTSYEQEVEESFTAGHEQKFLSVSFDYAGAKYHKVGKGFLGFDLVRETNKLKGVYTNKYFNIDNNYFHVVNDRNETFQIADNRTVSKTDNLYAFDNLDDPDLIRYFCKLIESTEKTYDATGLQGFKSAVKTTYEDFDDYGNPKIVTAYFGTTENVWPLKESRVTEFLNIINSEKYIIGLPDFVTSKYWSQEDGLRNREVDYIYNTNTGQLESATFEPGNPKSYTISYIYDEGLNTFGNITQVKYDATTGIEPRIWSHKFDKSGRFLQESTNPMGHVESYSYYHDIGKLLSSTDPNGFTTIYEYDVLGSLKKTTYPDKTVSCNVNRWCVGSSSAPPEDAPESSVYYLWSARSGSPEVLTFYDQFNRVVRTVTIGFDGSKIYHDKDYFGQTGVFSGLPRHESVPYFKPTDPNYEPPLTTFGYNALREPTLVSNPDGSSKSIIYSKNIQTVVDFDNQSKKLEYNGAGWLTKITDNNETSIEYKYRADGLLASTHVVGLSTTTTQYLYDDFGNPTKIIRPNNGVTTYVYNAFGDLLTETDQRYTISYTVDKLGRTTETTVDDDTEGYTTAWQYDTQTNGIGKLHATIHAPNTGHVQAVAYEYSYDEYGRLSKEKQKVNAQQLTFEYTYDDYGRLKQTLWPSGYRTTSNYNEYGKLVSILDKHSNQLWRARKTNAREQYTKVELGTCVDQETNYDINNGNITDIVSRNVNDNRLIQSYNYAWLTNGNLEHRRDNLKSLTETFDYDAYNRLTNAKVNNIQQLNLNYRPYGNIQNKSDLGTYVYDDVKPNALTEIPGIPESISQNFQRVDFTPFDKVYHISEKETADSETDLISLDIGYGPSHERVWQKFNDHINGTSLEKHYFNSIYEQQVDEKGNTKQLHYIVAPTGLFAIFTVENEEVFTMNYLLKDHLGSINYVLNDHGDVVQELNFDAWGQRRDPVTWQYYTSTATVPAPLFSRGFTMHEHLDAFKLINMNGRMYDPVVARFLSPDPLIQFPENSQSYNSYSYVLNNPLRFTDPSGFLVDWFINELTGDVYYNSEYKKGDETKIEGEGWVHFAENGKLSEKSSDDFALLWSNKELWDNYGFSSETSYNPKGEKVLSFGVEAMFKGNNAKEFMSRQGYDFKPILYKFHSDVTTEYHPEPHGQVTLTHDNSKVESVLSSRYISQDLVLKNTLTLGNYQDPDDGTPKSFGPMYSIRNQSWTIRQNVYGTSAFGRKAGKTINWLEKNTPWKSVYEGLWKKALK